LGQPSYSSLFREQGVAPQTQAEGFQGKDFAGGNISEIDIGTKPFYKKKLLFF
jgi:hypothetical protein